MFCAFTTLCQPLFLGMGLIPYGESWLASWWRTKNIWLWLTDGLAYKVLLCKPPSPNPPHHQKKKKNAWQFHSSLLQELFWKTMTGKTASTRLWWCAWTFCLCSGRIGSSDVWTWAEVVEPGWPRSKNPRRPGQGCLSTSVCLARASVHGVNTFASYVNYYKPHTLQ